MVVHVLAKVDDLPQVGVCCNLRVEAVVRVINRPHRRLDLVRVICQGIDQVRQFHPLLGQRLIRALRDVELGIAAVADEAVAHQEFLTRELPRHLAGQPAQRAQTVHVFDGEAHFAPRLVHGVDGTLHQLTVRRLIDGHVLVGGFGATHSHAR